MDERQTITSLSRLPLRIPLTKGNPQQVHCNPFCASVFFFFAIGASFLRCESGDGFIHVNVLIEVSANLEPAQLEG